MENSTHAVTGIASNRLAFNVPVAPRHPLDGAIARIDRAREHLEEFGRLANEYGRKYLAEVTVEPHPYLPQQVRVRAFQSNRSIVPIFGVIAGEAAYNLRAAMDYLIYELAILDTGNAKNRTQFPIESTPGRFQKRVNDGWLNGLNVAHVAAVEKLQPYNGANWTAALRDINNPDKHRHLTAIFGSQNVQCTAFGHDRFPEFEDRAGIVRSTRTMSGTDVHVHLDATILVTLDDGRPVVETLDGIRCDVLRTVEAFRPEFT